jgi:serine/threonine-protein kinase
LTQEQAEAVHREMREREERGEAIKARQLCVQVGMLDADQARALKHEVRSYLERKASQESRPQRRIAGFEIESRLGCGAMGVVFKARHVGLNKTVALKLLNPEFANDPKYVARFLQEARAAARLDHPGIVQAYDVGKADDVHFIAMEFVKGKTVKELVDRRKALTEAAAIEIVIQVLTALRHAHEQSVIHRDVKPANIMITREGQAKLLDLGLARQTDVENGLTGEGRAIGTPYYMAPEQALDKGADYRADLYSLGVTLFNMVTGRKPFEGSTPVAVMNMHIKAPVPDVLNVVP